MYALKQSLFSILDLYFPFKYTQLHLHSVNKLGMKTFNAHDVTWATVMEG